MSARFLGTLTIGQAPRPDVVPIIDRHVPAEIARIHRGALDGLTRAEIDAHVRARPRRGGADHPAADGGAIQLSRRRMRERGAAVLRDLEDDGCDVDPAAVHRHVRRPGMPQRLAGRADHIIPATVAGLVERRQIGILVPIAGQIVSEAEKWRPLARPPIFAAASPYDDRRRTRCSPPAHDCRRRGAEAILLDCIGFTERHRARSRRSACRSCCPTPSSPRRSANCSKAERGRESESSPHPAPPPLAGEGGNRSPAHARSEARSAPSCGDLRVPASGFASTATPAGRWPG